MCREETNQGPLGEGSRGPLERVGVAWYSDRPRFLKLSTTDIFEPD